MMRQIFGSGRKVLQKRDGSNGSSSSGSDGESYHHEEKQSEDESLESWTAWIQRTTRDVEEYFRGMGGEDWIEEQRRRKWRWAGHTARRCDERWSRALLDWTPSGHRRKGHPHKRWNEDLVNYFKVNLDEKGPIDSWKHQAIDRDIWKEFEIDFLAYCDAR
jgi:hypothetical protein